MQKTDHFAPFMAGLGVGVVASLLLAPEAGRNARNRIKGMTSRVGAAMRDLPDQLNSGASRFLKKRETVGSPEDSSGRRPVSDMKAKAKQKIDDAAAGAKAAAERVVEKSTDVAHGLGKAMEQGGKHLQDA